MTGVTDGDHPNHTNHTALYNLYNLYNLYDYPNHTANGGTVDGSAKINLRVLGILATFAF